MAPHLYYRPPRLNWVVGLPWWLAIFVGMLYLVGVVMIGALMLCVFLLIEAGKGGAWLWRRWRR